ncbi:ATP-binding cassette, subfamily B, multidrug efflux pump [Tenacibaculum aestuariivivum]
MRYFIELAYNGKNYHGWQIQPDAISVQEKINSAISTILRENITITGAGRTDAGVHALQMFAHFDTNIVLANNFAFRLNALLPDDIVIFNTKLMHNTAHARFDATSRSYEYKIWIGRNPFLLDTSWQLYNQKLNIDLMNQAAAILYEYEDFECFSKVKSDVHTFNCTVTNALWVLNGNDLTFHISANRFLRNMVRAVVGTLIDIGIGKITLDDFRKIIASKNRSNAGTSVPAKGLFLTKVAYIYIYIVSKTTGKAFDIKIFVRLMSFAKKYRAQFIIAASSTILLAVFAVLSPIILMRAIDDFVTHKDLTRLLYFTIAMLVALVIQVFFQFSFIYYANWVGQHIIRDIRTKTFRKIMSFKMSYFDNSSVGKMVTRVVSDIETIANFFTQGVFMIFSDILKMIIVIIVMFYTNWKLAIIALATLPILIYATKLFQIAIKSTFQDVRNQVANLNGFVQERVTGMKIVQLFNREKIEYKNFIEINEKHKKAHIKTVWYYSIFFPIAEILSSIAIGLIVWYGGLQVINDNTVSVGAIIGFIKMAQMLFRPLRQIADKFNQLQMGIVAGERVFNIIDTSSSITKSGKITTNALQGNIAFKNVHFSYIKGEEILKGITFNVEKGKTIAIVGATGAGKSTIINLINRFYEIDSGAIYLDNIPVEDYEINALREKIAVVLQDVFLFSDTIFNNISLKNENITLEEVKKAAKQIGIHQFIMSLPNNYDYNVKERGGMLSSGQRQLIAFLRAYVSNPNILILDEATSSIDSSSEKMIQFATDKITKNRTSIVIAHRLATIKKADTIIVMDKGKIVEEGNHTELLKKEGGYYKNLYKKQFKTEITS